MTVRTLQDEYVEAIEDVLADAGNYNSQSDTYEVSRGAMLWLKAVHRLVTGRTIKIGDPLDRINNVRVSGHGS